MILNIILTIVISPTGPGVWALLVLGLGHLGGVVCVNPARMGFIYSKWFLRSFVFVLLDNVSWHFTCFIWDCALLALKPKEQA